MSEIKTREKVRNIKTIDKAAITGTRIRNSLVRSKTKAENLTNNDSSPNEYASDNLQYAAGDFSLDVAHVAGYGAKIIAQTGKNVILRRRDRKVTRNREEPADTVKQLDRTIKGATKSHESPVTESAESKVKGFHRVTKSSSAAIKTSERGTTVGRAPAKTRLQAVQASRSAARAAATKSKTVSKAVASSVKAIISATQELISSIATGGIVAMLVIVVICLIGLLIGSPFGIFFSNEDSETGLTMPEAVSQISAEFTETIQQITESVPHDTLDMDGAGNAAALANWNNVLAVYAVYVTTDTAMPAEVATVTEEKLDILREIFWDMNEITYSVTYVEHTLTQINDKGEEVTVTTTETILHISVSVKDCQQMVDEYGFTEEQRDLLDELTQPEYKDLFSALTGGVGIGAGGSITLTPQEIREIISQLPENLSELRKQVILTAYQLLGKVNYFWGGKSLTLGWDSRWGTPMTVTAPGSSSTGTVRPFGLDCSGFVDWVFYNVSGGTYVFGQGGGTYTQHANSTNISWSEAIPGDVVFYPGDSHVGIVCGFDANGNVLIIHCASGYNNVVVTGQAGFTTITRPRFYS